MKKSRRKYEQPLALKAMSQPKLFFAHVRRNQHLKKNISGFKDNAVETIFTPSAQAEVLKNFYSSIFSENDPRPTPTLPDQTIEMPVPLFSISVVHRELVLMTFTRRWYAGLLVSWLNPCLNYSPIPQQRQWYLLTGAWPLYAQYIKKGIQRTFPTTDP